MSSQKHILFISSWYPNRNHATHGIFNRYFAEAASLYNKISVLHVCSDENMKDDFELTETSENNLDTTIVYYKKIPSTVPFVSQYLKRNKVIKAYELGYRKLLAHSGKPDLIHLNVVMPAGIGAEYLSKKYNIPFVINECWTGYTPEDGNYKGFLLKYFTKRIIAKGRALMPVSKDLQNAMSSHGLNGKYVVVPNVVNTDLFVPSDTGKSSNTSFLHISSIDDQQKNVSGIVRAFATALHENPEMKLNIVGQGNDLDSIKKLVSVLGLNDKICFRGRVLKEELVKEINANDALVMFSNYETFCLVIAETFACGKPVITTDAGGIKDYMSPELGITLNKKDENGLARAFLDFAGRKIKFDSKYIRDFAVNNYSNEVIGKKLSQVYRSVLDK